MSLLNINTNQIALGYLPRRRKHGEEELVKSIEREGLLDPITVRPEGDHFIVIDGQRRLAAVKSLGWEKVQCLVEDVDEKAAAHMSFIKNAERKSLSPIDIAQHVQYMMERYGYNVEDLVRLGYAVHRSTLDNYLHLLELPEDIQDKVSNGDIPATAGYHIYRLKDENCRGSWPTSFPQEKQPAPARSSGRSRPLWLRGTGSQPR